MNEPANPRTLTLPASGLKTARVAVLVVDLSGKVVSANQEAKAMWQAGADELVGEFFPSLFALDIVSDEPEMLAAQWDIVLGALLDKRAVLPIQPKEGSRRPMAVRAERAMGGLSGYFIMLEEPQEPAAPAASRQDEAAAALQLFAESGPVGFFDLNLTTRRVLYSPAWKRLLGYGEAELADTYDAWLGLLHPEDSAAAPDKAGRKFKVGTRPFSVEFRMRHKQGHWVWIQCVGLQIADATGELERVLGIQLDATERKEVEGDMAASDARLRALADEGSLAAFEIDFAGGPSWFSAAWLRLLGGVDSPASGPGALADALPPDECPGGLEEWLTTQAPGQADFSRCLRLRAVDGRSVAAGVGFHRTLNRKRQLERVVGYAVPLSEAELPAADTASSGPPALDPLSRALFSEVLAALSEGVIATDTNGIVLFANGAASRLLGVPTEGFIGRTLDQIFPLVDRQSGKAAESLSDRILSANGHLSLIGDQSVRTEPGPVVPVVWSGRAAFSSNGKPRGIVIAFRNPEELTLTPDELIKANRFEGLGLLASGIAHDFNNLLTTILGGIAVAKDNRDGSLLPDAEKAGIAAKALTKQLLLFAKGQTGSLAPCEPKDILDDAVKVATVGSMVEVTVQVVPGAGLVNVDRGQMMQVFQNLIVNALQAMPPRPHRPRVQLKAAAVHLPAGQIASLPEGDYVEFEVRDNGGGIPAEILERVWDPFFTTKKHGSGLGLATVLSIVRKLGGEIGVQTAVGEGTVFSIFLPRLDQPSDVQARSAPSQRFSTGRVLFMDDDPHICALSATMLENLSYKYDLAKNGEEAIALYRQYLEQGRPYDAVVMDLTVIGGLGGEETFKALHELDPDVRAIVSSGYDSEELAQQYLDLGFCGYLTKPYRVTDLGKVLKAVLG